MNLIRTLTDKPWLPRDVDAVPALGRLPGPAPRIGLIVFLAVASMLFALLSVAYLMRMGFGDWIPLSEPPILWLNTLLLVLSSLGLHAAWVSARRGQLAAARMRFLAGGLGAVTFLAGQAVAWQQLAASGHAVASNPANTFFYLISALHGLHLLGGLVAWGRTAARLRHGRSSDAAGIRLSIELCTTYWHFLLVLWLALFGLLLADNGGLLGLPMIEHAH